jgi:hypothetical protein
LQVLRYACKNEALFDRVSQNTQEILMSKRALYAIPLAGLTLTGVGCKGDEPPPPAGDQLVDTFSLDVFLNTPLPYTALAADVYQDGSLICDITTDADDVIFAADLTANINLNTTAANCVDAAGAAATPPADQTSSYDLAGTVVTLNAAYTITVTAADGTQVDDLTCTLSGNALNCLSSTVADAELNFTKL